ncbi:hypothetical protein cyc_03800 [Cyclospora cayetanensis]|uniref:Uncharacterized protein n=1 Tax=Cyclospora cayetanensis TaxID=88456 RepID=A0A1D3CSG0_9EIME|nr:hypothetical protein cyc_03800 [Cyclospora cayetanensis]
MSTQQRHFNFFGGSKPQTVVGEAGAPNAREAAASTAGDAAAAQTPKDAAGKPGSSSTNKKGGLFAVMRSSATPSGAEESKTATKEAASPSKAESSDDKTGSSSSTPKKPRVPLMQRLKYFSFGFFAAGTAALVLLQQQVEDCSRAALRAAADAAVRISMLEDKINRVQQQQQ